MINSSIICKLRKQRKKNIIESLGLTPVKITKLLPSIFMCIEFHLTDSGYQSNIGFYIRMGIYQYFHGLYLDLPYSKLIYKAYYNYRDLIKSSFIVDTRIIKLNFRFLTNKIQYYD